MSAKRSRAEDVLDPVPPKRNAQGLRQTRGLCDVCSSQEMKHLLKSASKIIFDLTMYDYNNTNTNLWCVDLGHWSDLQYRSRTCKLCGAVSSLLYETSVKNLISDGPTQIDEVVKCGLGLRLDCYWGTLYRGYFRIHIILEIRERLETYSSISRVRLKDAFQVSNTLLREPQVKVDSRAPDSATASRPRLMPETVSPTLIHQWLNICRHKHGDRCIVYHGDRIFPIRLVDVRSRTITTFAQNDSKPPYVALSWVWGSAKPSDGMTSDRLPHASKEGFLSTLQLPTTVSDAAMLLGRLGMRYLWVDILCIVQDNDDDKDLYIPFMGSVYTASEFTIIANGKNGASDGLPGVRAATRPRVQQVVHYDELTLVSGLNAKFVKIADELEQDLLPEPNPPWQTRAWTLQEKLLSRRCLIFGANQMHWECLEASFCEESHFESLKHGTVPLQWSSRSLFSWDLMRQPRDKQFDSYHNYHDFHSQYCTLVCSYTQRDITLDSDALNAFQGILNTLSSHTGIQFQWGLPCSLFEQNLLWSTSSGHKRNHHGFPSWSWLNYRFVNAVDEWHGLYYAAATRCYIRTDVSPNGGKSDLCIQPVTDENRHASNNHPFVEGYPGTDASEARTVEIADIPLALRMSIQPLFHLIFWADILRVRCVRSSLFDSFDLYLRGEGSDDTIPEFLHDKRISSIDLLVSELTNIDTTQNDENWFVGHPKLYGTATLDTGPPDGRRVVDCELVKVVDRETRHPEMPIEQVLLIVEKDGIAERVGLAVLPAFIHDRFPWTQRLIILG